MLAWFFDCAIAGVIFLPLNPLLYTPADEPNLALVNLLAAAGTVFVFGYLIAFDGGRRGATPGKRILGIRVADAERDGPIGYRRAAIRRLGYILGAIPLFLGWFWGLVDSQRQTWHDKMAGTVVIRSR